MKTVKLVFTLCMVILLCNLVKAISQCPSDLTLSATYTGGTTYCDKLSYFSLTDTECTYFPPPGDCWNGYANATLELPSSLSTTDGLTKTLTTDSPNYDWSNAVCSVNGIYSINVTLENASGIKCYSNLTLDLSYNSTSPLLNLYFPLIPNTTIGSHTFNITLNNSGLANATSISFQISTSNLSIINLNQDVSVSLLENRTILSYPINFIALSGGNIYFATSDILYHRSNGAQMPALPSQSSNTFHINYNPIISQLPNVTIMINSYNATVNLSEYYSDQDTYDPKENAVWGYSGNTNITVNISSNKMLNLTPGLNFIGRRDITFSANDSYNMTATGSMTVFVHNGSNDVHCDGIDEDGDTLLDEDYAPIPCCAYSSCVLPGATTCISGAVQCIGSIELGGSSPSGSPPPHAHTPECIQATSCSATPLYSVLSPYSFYVNQSLNVSIDFCNTPDWVNLSLTSPTGRTIFSNVQVNKTNNYWNTSELFVNESGAWPYSVYYGWYVCNSDNLSFSHFGTISIPDNLSFTSPQIQSVMRNSENRSFIIGVKSDILPIFNFSLSTDLNANFTVIFNQTSILIDSEDYVYFNLTIGTTATSSNEVHTGNLILQRPVANKTWTIPITIEVATTIGDIELVTSPNYAFRSCGGSITTSFLATNYGNYTLRNCHPFLIDSNNNEVGTSTDDGFNLAEDATKVVHITYPMLGSMDTYFDIRCYATAANSYDTISGKKPLIKFETECRLAVGGGGGAQLISPSPVVYVSEPIKIENISNLCGNHICEKDFGETPWGCPIDCAKKEEFKVEDVLCLPLFKCGTWKEQWFINGVIIVMGGFLIFYLDRSKNVGRLSTRGKDKDH